MRLFENTNYDFIKWRWHALVGSALVILAGLGLMVSRGGMPMGIDFTGGTIVVAKFEAEARATPWLAADAASRGMDGKLLLDRGPRPYDRIPSTRLTPADRRRLWDAVRLLAGVEG